MAKKPGLSNLGTHYYMFLHFKIRMQAGIMKCYYITVGLTIKEAHESIFTNFLRVF